MRALIFSCDPGGANAVIPLVLPLRQRGFDVALYGKEAALKKYRQAGLLGFDIGAETINLNEFWIKHFLELESPQIIITATSANDFTERYLWKMAEVLNIPSFAIVDQWINYGLRFSNYGVNAISNYALDPVHPFLPTRIIAMDEFAQQEMIEDGLPADLISICGQPYFETIFNSVNDSKAEIFFCRQHQIANNDHLIVFASEPITSTYGECASSYWGYTELSVLSNLLDALETLQPLIEGDIVLLVRPHPKENTFAINKLLKRRKKIRSLVDTNTPAQVVMYRADLVCGMSSMFLIESTLLGRPTLSIQIGLCREDPFILGRRHLLETIKTTDCLKNKVYSALLGELEPALFSVITNPVERIILDMEKFICPI